MIQNRRFWVELTYNNVGQGLFYSGRIDDFNFIYDCGSENRRHMLSVIRDFKRQKLTGSKVDLLILSHLHDDHVSGLSALFENGTLVDTVVLPYLSPVERLMVSFENLAAPSWMYSFWADSQPAYCFSFPNKFRIYTHNVFGHLLLGDIDMKKKWLEVDTHYRGYLSKVTLALVPHHGSDQNWNKAILDKTMSNCCWVTSAGIFNKYGHPSSTVLQDVISRGGSLYCCNEGSEVSTRCFCAC